MKHEKVAVALLEAGGLRLSQDEPFVLASRKIGPLYIDVRQLTATPSGWSATIDELAAIVASVGDFEAVSGGELADLFFSVPVALRLGKPHLAIRKAPKAYGAGGGGRLVGRIEEGQRVVHVSDLITSGTSALDWVDTVRSAGGRVEHYAAVFDRDQGGKEALREKGVELHSLLTLGREFLAFAVDRGFFPEAGLESIESYLHDPDGWARDYLRRRPEFLTGRIQTENGRLARPEGLEVLTRGYPELVPELRDVVRRRLRELGVDERLLNSAGT